MYVLTFAFLGGGLGDSWGKSVEYIAGVAKCWLEKIGDSCVEIGMGYFWGIDPEGMPCRILSPNLNL